MIFARDGVQIGLEKQLLKRTPSAGQFVQIGRFARLTAIDRRFVNPLLEFNGKEKDFVNGQYGPRSVPILFVTLLIRTRTSHFSFISP